MHRRFASWAACIALPVLLLAAGGPAPAAAQEGGEEESRWFPAESAFTPLLAAPREVTLRGSVIVADREAFRLEEGIGTPPGPLPVDTLQVDFEGSNFEAEVAIGHQLPVVRLQEGGLARPELVLGIEVGVFARFFLESAEFDFINSDWRVGLPLSFRQGLWEARLTLRHVSSHLGDDFLARFEAREPSLDPVSKDGFEFLLARWFAGPVRAYAGAEANFHRNPGFERVAGRLGVEWRPEWRRDPGTGTGTWPYLAMEVESTDERAKVAGTVVAGAAFRIQRALLRLEARGHFGPSAMGHFRTVDEPFGGIQLRVEL